VKILIVNLHSSRNAGDDVLTSVTVQQLTAVFAPVCLTLAMNDPHSYQGQGNAVGSFLSWLKDDAGRWRPISGSFLIGVTILLLLGYRLLGASVLRFALRRQRPLLRAYFDADLVISSAGNFLYSSGRVGAPFLLAIYSLAYAWLCGKPLYMMPQTIGPLHRGWERSLVRWAAGKIRLVFVRDAISMAELQAMNAWHSGCYLVPDLAFALPRAARQQGERLLQEMTVVPERDRPLLGVTLINWGAQNITFKRQAEYETAVAAAIRAFLTTHGGRALLFAQVGGPAKAEDDRVPALRVKEQLSALADSVVVAPAHVPAEQLKAAYGLMDIFMGSRLHSNIFALSEGVPAVTIQYQYKTRGVLRMLDLEQWVIDIEAVTAPDLSACLERLWQQRHTVRAHIAQVMPPIIGTASAIAARIKADFQQIQ
jgi:colanic acid/amylovoran biosynthesis protein